MVSAWSASGPPPDYCSSGVHGLQRAEAVFRFPDNAEHLVAIIEAALLVAPSLFRSTPGVKILRHGTAYGEIAITPDVTEHRQVLRISPGTVFSIRAAYFVGSLGSLGDTVQGPGQPQPACLQESGG
jgi:hypothetical protein